MFKRHRDIYVESWRLGSQNRLAEINWRLLFRIGPFIILIGCIMVLSPWWSRLYGAYQQHKLEMVIKSEKFNAGSAGGQDEPGSGMTPPFVISIAAIDLHAVVVSGVTDNDLRKGPGLYPQGVYPGLPGNASIAGHRDIYGAWFRKVNLLKKGDRIVLSRNKRRIIYEVEQVFLAAPDDWSVISATPYRTLTLTTCDPPGGATKRLIVRAKEMEDSIIANNPGWQNYLLNSSGFSCVAVKVKTDWPDRFLLC